MGRRGRKADAVDRLAKAWRRRSSSGDARDVPKLLLRAAYSGEVDEALEAFSQALRHGVENGALFETGSAMAEELLDGVEGRGRFGRPCAHPEVFLSGLLALLWPGASAKWEPRTPPDGELIVGLSEPLQNWAAARVRFNDVVAVVARRASILKALVVSRDPGVACTAVAVATLAGVGLTPEQLWADIGARNEIAQVSIVASLPWSAERSQAPREALAGRAAMLDSLLSGEHPFSELVVGSICTASTRDFPWAFGSLSYVFCAALVISGHPGTLDILLESVRRMSVPPSDVRLAEDEVYLPWPPCASAAYWYLRVTLRARWLTGEILDPADLSKEEYNAINRLADVLRDNPHGDGFGEFGLRPFFWNEVRTPWVSEHVEGIFDGCWRRWARWKWVLMARESTRRLAVHEASLVRKQVEDFLLEAVAIEQLSARRIELRALQ